MDRKDDLFMCKLSEQACRFQEMVDCIGRIASVSDVILSVEEQLLLSTSYKRIVGQLREAWRKVLAQEELEKLKGDTLSQALLVATAYREQLEAELRTQCNSLLRLLDGNLLRNPTCNATSRAFYLKLKADYHRYKAEFQTGDERKEAAGNALLAYKNAMAEAERSVPSAERAKAVAQKAFDDGIASLSELEADQRAQSMQILQLLRDNLTAWHDANQCILGGSS
eukprot:gene24606-7196_t